MNEQSAVRARRYREYAEEIRMAAEDVKHPESRLAMLRIAATYDKLATRIEREHNPA